MAIVLGDLGGIEEECEEDLAKALISNHHQESLWRTPQIITSGWEFNTVIALTDSQRNLLNFDYSSTASIETLSGSDSDIIIENGGKLDAIKGLFKFKNVKIITKPNTTLFLRIVVNYHFDLFFKSAVKNSSQNKDLSIETNMKLFVRPCWRGETLMPDFTCKKCEQGKIMEN